MSLTNKKAKNMANGSADIATWHVPQYFDPTIEFWKVLVHKEDTTSFCFYFCGHSNTEAAAGLYNGSTDKLFLLAKNMGFKPHVRIQNSITCSDKWMANSWLRAAKEVGADVKTFLFSFPMDEFKQVISSGIPVIAGSPCHDDCHVLEGYSKARLYARVSSEEEVEGYSIDAQRRAFQALVEGRGWIAYREYIDEGKSARTDNINQRPVFKEMIADALAGRCYNRSKGWECPQKSALLEVYEEQIKEYLNTFHIPQDYQSKILEAHHRLQAAYDNMDTVRAKWEAQLERIRNLYKWGDISKEDYL